MGATFVNKGWPRLGDGSKLLLEEIQYLYCICTAQIENHCVLILRTLIT